MLIGIDFDNTIVCYDDLFHRLATDRGLIDPAVPAVKEQVRDTLRRQGREDEWTALQGIAYGPELIHARPFPGVLAFFHRCHQAGIQLAIVSHKTRHPYLGPRYDLHAAAHAFLLAHNFYDTDRTGLNSAVVYLEPTKQAKMERIAALGCDVFVDDLPELLTDPQFPIGPQRILFTPANRAQPADSFTPIRSWPELWALLFTAERLAG